MQNFALAFSGEWGAPWLSVTWSLAVEAQFYLILPAFIRRLPRRRLPYALVTLIIFAPVVRTLLILNGLPTSAPFALLPGRMDALLLGVFCACMLRDPPTFSYLRNHIPALCRVAGIIAAIDLVLLFQQPPPFAPLTASIGYSGLDLLYACLLLIVCLNHQHILSRLTRFGPLAQLGIVSYGIFLFHGPVNQFAYALILGQEPGLQSPAAIAVAPVAFLVTLALATLSWNIFEKKMLGLAHRTRYGPTSSSPVAPAPDRPEGAATP